MNRKLVRAVVGCVAVVLVWAGIAGAGLPLLPPPGEIVAAAAGLAREGPMLGDMAASLYRVALGVSIAIAATLVLTATAILSPQLSDVVAGPLEVVRPIPPIAWIPVAIMIFGIGSSSSIAIVAVGAFFPMWLSALRGVAAIRRAHIMAARSLGARSLQLLGDIIVPSWLPHALHGLRLGVGMGWFSVVAAEMMGATSGLGQRVQLFSLNLQVAELYAYILTIGVLGFTINHLLLTLERRAGAWQSTESWRDE